MDTVRLKNVIILILALMNLFLLGSLGLRQLSRQTSSREAARQLTALFEKDGIALDEDTIPSDTPPAGRTLARSAELDGQMAAFVLGTGLRTADQGGGIYFYEGDAGSAQFRSSGSFDITCSVTPDDPEAFVRRFCRKFDYDDLVSTLEDGDGTVSAVQYYDRLSVVNCTVVFLFQDGVLRSVSGAHVPNAYTALSEEEPLSALTALSRFLEVRRASGAVMSSVSDVYLCYELQTSASSPLSLEPAWCIVTDTVSYYVNAMTGSVSHS